MRFVDAFFRQPAVAGAAKAILQHFVDGDVGFADRRVLAFGPALDGAAEGFECDRAGFADGSGQALRLPLMLGAAFSVQKRSSLPPARSAH
jgi:hypothetical protein